MLSVETLSLAKAYTDKVKEQLSVGFTPKIVESLPTLGQNNILYLVLKKNGQEEGNIYNEYIWIDNKYEFIGNTDTSFIVDNALSATSENPVQNKVITAGLNNKADINNPLSLSDNDKTKSMALIQHNYDSDTQTDKYVARSIDVNTLSESGLAAYNIPTSKAVAQYVKNAINSAITTALNTEV